MLLSKCLVLFFFILSVGKSYGEVLFLAETGFIVENKVVVTSSREDTWRMFSQDVDQWWPSDHTWWGEESTLSIGANAGGCFCESHENKSAEHMRVSFVEPARVLRMLGGLGPLQGLGMYGALEWTFKDNDQGTEVTMTYKVNGINPGGFKALAPIVDRVQALQLSGLARFVNEGDS